MTIFEGMSRAELEGHRSFHKQQLAEIAAGQQSDQLGMTRMMRECALEAVEEELAKLDRQPATAQPAEPSAMMTIAAFTAILSERAAQQAKWGTQRHDFTVWQTVLSEEAGELAEAILNHRAHVTPKGRQEALLMMREEAVQVAAVAVSMIEHIDELMGELPSGGRE